MQIQVNTDHNIEGREKLAHHIETDVMAALGRFGDKITRVEVHLSDETGPKSGGVDKRCLMEARLAGLKPVAVSHEGKTLEEAYDGAAKKMQRMLESTLGRLNDHKGATSIRSEDVAEM